MATMTGCGDFFAEKPTELQSRNILKELSQIHTIADPNVQIPEIYANPPVILEMPGDGARMVLWRAAGTQQEICDPANALCGQSRHGHLHGASRAKCNLGILPQFLGRVVCVEYPNMAAQRPRRWRF